MPTYQYTCKACGEPLEVVQSFHDAPLTECPHCGGELRKVFSSVGVVFKGSGFYRTDSRSGAKSATSSSATSDSSSTKTESTSSKSESTSAAKPAASKGSDSAA